MVTRSYDGPALDARYQFISERPELDDHDDDEGCDELDREAEDVVYATPAEPAGEERVENVPIPIPRDDQPRTLEETVAIPHYTGTCDRLEVWVQ